MKPTARFSFYKIHKKKTILTNDLFFILFSRTILRSHPQQPEQYNDQIHDNTNSNAPTTNPSTENSPNNPLQELESNMIDRVNSENDVNELDKIFCDKNANSTTSDNDDSRSIPGIEDSDIGDDITNDDQKDSNSLHTSNPASTNPNLAVYSDVDHQQQHHHHHQQHQEVIIPCN